MDMEQTITSLTCLHCHYHWLPRKIGLPKACPACHRTRWAKPRQYARVVRVKRSTPRKTPSELGTYSE